MGGGPGSVKHFPSRGDEGEKALWQEGIVESGEVAGTVVCDEGEAGPVTATEDHSMCGVY